MFEFVQLELKIITDKTLADFHHILDILPIKGGDVDRDTVEFHSDYVYFEIEYDSRNHDRIVLFLQDMGVELDEEEMDGWEKLRQATE